MSDLLATVPNAGTAKRSTDMQIRCSSDCTAAATRPSSRRRVRRPWQTKTERRCRRDCSRRSRRDMAKPFFRRVTNATPRSWRDRAWGDFAVPSKFRLAVPGRSPGARVVAPADIGVHRSCLVKRPLALRGTWPAASLTGFPADCSTASSWCRSCRISAPAKSPRPRCCGCGRSRSRSAAGSIRRSG